MSLLLSWARYRNLIQLWLSLDRRHVEERGITSKIKRLAYILLNERAERDLEKRKNTYGSSYGIGPKTSAALSGSAGISGVANGRGRGGGSN